ncbi:MAG: tetratricopeptide repeat protein [candidate division WOR-3 bacterium]|nr:tetratricopeptide repeat protein [candidate division WOR-3 bacterium]
MLTDITPSVLRMNDYTPSTSKISTAVSFSSFLKSVIRQSDKELLDYAQRFAKYLLGVDDILMHTMPYEQKSLANLSTFPHHSFRFCSKTLSKEWQMPLYFFDDVLLRYTESEFNSLSPLQKHLEILRAESEARLIHHKLNFSRLSDWEYQQAICRALGILPMYLEDQIEELLTCPGFRTPTERAVDYDNIDQFINNLDMLKKELGTALELTYAVLLLNGVKSNTKFFYYAQKLDVLLSRISNLPVVSNQLKHWQSTDSLDAQLTFLSILRNQMAKTLPARNFDEDNFLFTNLLDQNWQRSKSIKGSKDVFAILDTILLTHWGFTVYIVITEKDEYLLEIVFPTINVWWQIADSSQILFVPPAVKYHYDYRFLIAKTITNIADMHMKIGREIDQAHKMYYSAVKLYPNYPIFLNKLVQLYLKTGQVHSALHQIKEISQHYPDAVEINHLLGLTYCLLKDYDNAIPYLEKVIAIKPDLIEAYNNLANCYYQNGKLEQAQKIYSRLLIRQPDYFEGVFGLGNVYFQLKQYAQALHYFEKALRITMHNQLEPQEKESQLIRTLYNLAQTYYELGEIETSIKTYKEILKLKPDHASAWYNLGIIYRDQGETKQAIECIARAIRINPNLMR